MLRPFRSERIKLETGPATILPLAYIELLKDAPREPEGYKVITDRHGTRIHLFNDFSGYHIYMVATSPKKKIIRESLNYFDKEQGLFSLSIEVMQSNGVGRIVNLPKCRVPLVESYSWGLKPASDITVHQFATGIPDSLGFDTPRSTECFRFANNLEHCIESTLSDEERHIFDLKIEYIGLAVGDEGSREVHERLGQGHKKETQVLNDIGLLNPHLDSYAVMFKPERLRESEFGPFVDSISFSDTVSILEKSLICQFQPNTYNSQDLNFPYNGGVYVSKLKQLGIKQILLTVDSPSENERLYSSEIEPAMKHRFQIEL